MKTSSSFKKSNYVCKEEPDRYQEISFIVWHLREVEDSEKELGSNGRK